MQPSRSFIFWLVVFGSEADPRPKLPINTVLCGIFGVIMSNPGVVVVVAVHAVVCMVVAVVGIRISDSFSEENRVIKSSSFF